jgi:hypothetical protein
MPNGFNQNIKVLIDNKLRAIKEIDNVKCFEKQTLHDIRFKPLHNSRTRHYIVCKCTRNQNWLLSDRNTVSKIRTGDRILIKPSVISKDNDDYKDGFVHGLIFADGTDFHSNTCRIQLFGWKEYYRELLESSQYYDRTNSYKQLIVLVDTNNFKLVPSDKNLEYCQGFFDGVKCFDGNHRSDGFNRVGNTDLNFVKFVSEYSGILDYIMTGHNITQPRYGGIVNGRPIFGKKPYHEISFQRGIPIEHIVTSIYENEMEEQIYFPEVNNFRIQNGIEIY